MKNVECTFLFCKKGVLKNFTKFTGKHRYIVKHELRVTSYELRVTSYELKASKHELKV